MSVFTLEQQHVRDTEHRLAPRRVVERARHDGRMV
jgi:hypothetical protein